MCFIMCILQYAAKILLFFYSRKRFQKKKVKSPSITHQNARTFLPARGIVNN